MTLHSIIRPYLILAQICGLFPVSGISRDNSSKLQFRWLSCKLFYSLAVWIASFTSFLMSQWTASLKRGTSQVITTTDYINILKFGAPSLLITPAFIHIATKWSRFIKEWERIEKRLPNLEPQHDYLWCLKCFSFAFFILKLALVFLVNANFMFKLSNCIVDLTLWEMFHLSYYQQYPLVFMVDLLPAPCLFVLAVVYDLLFHCQSLCAPMLLTTVSLTLLSKLQALNRLLEHCKGRLMPVQHWQKARETYSCLSQLIRLSDQILNIAVLVTCLVETLFMILFIYLALGYSWPGPVFVLICVALSFHTLVNVTVVLSMSAVYDQSKVPLPVLTAIPYTHYTQEVARFYYQVVTDKMAFTGGQFFHVTRSLMLTIVSTIVTYEVVLIQFTDTSMKEVSSKNQNICRDTIRPLYNSLHNKTL